MAQQHINTGSDPNDFTGDPLRTAFKKTEDNFIELYDMTGGSTFPVTASVTEPLQMVGGNSGEDGTLGVTGSIEATTSITASSIVTDELASSVNSTTRILFESNKQNYYVNNEKYLLLDGANGGVIVNPDANDINFRAYTDSTSVPALNVDAGTNKIGIKTSSPTKDFEVNGDIKADEYHGNITEGDPEVLNQFFQTSSQALGATSPPYFQVVCVSQG